MGEDNNKTEHIRRQKGRSEITASSLLSIQDSISVSGNLLRNIHHQHKQLERTIPADNSKIKEMSAG